MLSSGPFKPSAFVFKSTISLCIFSSVGAPSSPVNAKVKFFIILSMLCSITLSRTFSAMPMAKSAKASLDRFAPEPISLNICFIPDLASSIPVLTKSELRFSELTFNSAILTLSLSIALDPSPNNLFVSSNLVA